MKTSIPNNHRIFQDNKNQFNGNIAESFNLDLTSNRGKFGSTRTKKITDVLGDISTFPYPVIGITEGNENLVYINSASVYNGGLTAFTSTFTPDSFAIGDNPDLSNYGDVLTTNGVMFMSAGDSLSYTNLYQYGIWNNISSPALTNNTLHLLTSLGDNTYVTDKNDKVGQIDKDKVLTLTGTGTLDLQTGGTNSGYFISVFMSGLDRIWIGLSGRSSSKTNGTTYVYEWDGESENTYNQRYEIDASGLLSGVVKDGVPYVLDTNGRLLKYTGSTFSEVARIPFKDGELSAGYNSTNITSRAMHPRCMTVNGDEILINVSNRLLDGWADFPSGVWSYTEDFGMVHKFSASYQAVLDTGTTNITDYGQIKVLNAGVIFVHDTANLYGEGEGGRIIFSQVYFNSSNDDVSPSGINQNYVVGIFADDTQDNTQKYGYFITTEIHTQDVEELWQTIYPKYKQLINSSDKCVVKYRVESKEKLTGDISWSNSNTFLTSLDITDYEQGDEMQVLQGIGSGKSFTIDTITSTGSGYSVTVKETFTNATGTAKVQFSNFKYLGEITNEESKGFKAFTISQSNQSPMIQFKVCMEWTGKNELYGIQANSNSNIK
jgi:hypothetical protein